MELFLLWGGLLLSIIMLFFGAEFSLTAAEKVGLYFGFSPLVIGLLLVGFGTSLPEFFVSQLAASNNETGLAMGNILGSNVANLFLILGISGMITTLQIQRDEIRAQFVLHIVITIILILVIFYMKVLNLYTLGIFSGFFALYLGFTFREMKKERHLSKHEKEEHVELGVMVIGQLIVGFVLLYAGGELLVKSGKDLGARIGLSTYVISAIFVAFGTSFPELITALVACYKKKNTDLITGNIIGSNIFNVAFVLGSLGFYDIKIEGSFDKELISLVVAAFFLLILTLLRKNFTRISGVLFFGTYIYMVYSWI